MSHYYNYAFYRLLLPKQRLEGPTMNLNPLPLAHCVFFVVYIMRLFLFVNAMRAACRAIA